MTSSKINLLLLPLLFTILLSTTSKLKIGQTLNSFFYTVLYPITLPISKLRLLTESQVFQIKQFPLLSKQNSDLKKQNANLVVENELLKQLAGDQKILTNLQTPFKEVLPVHLVGTNGSFTVSSSFPLDKVRPGQVLVSGNILLGLVSEIRNSLIFITPLNGDNILPFSVHTSTGQKGRFQYLNHLPQITDVPSQSPINLGDFVLTEPSVNLPGNLLVGKTIRLLSTTQEPLQKAEVSLYSSLMDNSQDLTIILAQ